MSSELLSSGLSSAIGFIKKNENKPNELNDGDITKNKENMKANDIGCYACELQKLNVLLMDDNPMTRYVKNYFEFQCKTVFFTY